MKKFFTIICGLVLMAGCCCKKNRQECQANECQQEEIELMDASLQEERVSGVLSAKEVGWQEADYE